RFTDESHAWYLGGTSIAALFFFAVWRRSHEGTCFAIRARSSSASPLAHCAFLEREAKSLRCRRWSVRGDVSAFSWVAQVSALQSGQRSAKPSSRVRFPPSPQNRANREILTPQDRGRLDLCHALTSRHALHWRLAYAAQKSARLPQRSVR